MTSKKIPFEWKLEQQEAFEALKKAMTTAPVLRKLNYKKDWVLEVDASDIALGAVLGQHQDDNNEVHLVQAAESCRAELQHHRQRMSGHHCC